MLNVELDIAIMICTASPDHLLVFVVMLSASSRKLICLKVTVMMDVSVVKHTLQRRNLV